MTKFTLVEKKKIDEYFDKMLQEAAEKLDAKDTDASFALEKEKFQEAINVAAREFLKANQAKDQSDKTKLRGEEFNKALQAQRCKVIEAKLDGAHPLVVFSMRMRLASEALKEKADKTTGEVKEEDFNTFKKALYAAHYSCVQAYKKEGNKSAYEYMLNAGKILIGAIIAIIASPVLLFSADRRTQLVETFFSGTHSDKSRVVQAALEENVERYVTCTQ